jgi:hypothetical protein
LRWQALGELPHVEVLHLGQQHDDLLPRGFPEGEEQVGAFVEGAGDVVEVGGHWLIRSNI